MAIRERTRDDARNFGGLLSPPLVPGGFYICTSVGAFEDSLTHKKWPGARAIVDPVTRKVVEIVDPPEPQQMFTHKTIRNPKDTSEIITVPFDQWDQAGTSDGLQRAIDVGILQHVPDDECKRFHKDAWEKRREKLVYDWRERHNDTESILDLLNQARAKAHAQIDLEAARDRNANALADADAAAGK